MSIWFLLQLLQPCVSQAVSCANGELLVVESAHFYENCFVYQCHYWGLHLLHRKKTLFNGSRNLQSNLEFASWHFYKKNLYTYRGRGRVAQNDDVYTVGKGGGQSWVKNVYVIYGQPLCSSCTVSLWKSKPGTGRESIMRLIFARTVLSASHNNNVWRLLLGNVLRFLSITVKSP